MRLVAVAVALLWCTACREYLVDPHPDPDGHVPIFRVSGAVWAPHGVDMPEGRVEVAVMRIDLRGERGPSLGGVWRRAEALGELTSGGTPFELELPRIPAQTELYAPDDEAGEFRIASYLVGAYVDRDGDHEPSVGDVLVAGSLELLIYADGSRPLGSEGLSLHMGWNRVSWRIDGAPDDVQDIGFFGNLWDHDMEANLLPMRRDAGLDGVVKGPLGPVRVDLYSIAEHYTGVRPPGATLQSVEVAAMSADTPFRFGAALGAMPEEHLFQNGDVTGADIGVAVAVAYVDVDGNAAFDPASDMYYGTSLNATGQPRMLVYIEPHDFTAAFYDQIYGRAAGWLLCESDRTVDWGLGVVVDREK